MLVVYNGVLRDHLFERGGTIDDNILLIESLNVAGVVFVQRANLSDIVIVDGNDIGGVAVDMYAGFVNEG